MRRTLSLLGILLPMLSWGQAVSIGDILCTDESIVTPQDFPFSGKIAWGIVFYVDASDSHGWAVALNDQSSSIKWCTSYEYDIPNLPNYENARLAMHDLDGNSNTGIIRAEGSSDLFPAAWAVDYDNGWYLPSAGQLRYLYSYVPEINASLQVVGGTVIPYQNNNCWWSSTEQSPYHAFDMNSGGDLGDYLKDNSNDYPPNGIAVRQIRDFQIQYPIHSTYHIGDVITNDDGSQGILFYINPNKTEGWMVGLNDASTYAQWGIRGNVPNLTDQTCTPPFGALLDETDGFANTSAIRSFENSQNIAANSVDYGNGWYLPTAGQLLKLFGALSFIEDTLQIYGDVLSDNCYWSSSEANDSEAYVLCCVSTDIIHSGHCIRERKSRHTRVRAVKNLQLIVNPPTVGDIVAPESICSGTSLELTIPQTQSAASQGWQLSPTSDFSNPIPYYGNPLDFEYNGWYLRYYVSNMLGTAYSNAVNISIWPKFDTSFNITSCTSYTWNETTYDETGIYQQVFTSAQGCDSIVTLYLNIGNQTMTNFAVSTCDSYTWNDTTYTETGIYDQTFTSVQGCDSIVILDLTIKGASYVSPIHGESLIYYQTNGSYIYSIDPVPGCFGYEWSLDGPWGITSSSDSPECTVNVNSPGTATLKVRVYTECGYIERILFINHDSRPSIVIYPNPTKADFNLVLFGMEGTAYIVIYDYLGQLIDRFSVETSVGGTTVPYSLAGKAAGVYLVSVTNNYYTVAKKVIKETASSYGFYNWEW